MIVKKGEKSLPQGGLEPGTFRSEDQCVDHWATLPLHRIPQKYFCIQFSVKKWGNLSFLSKMSADFENYDGFKFGFAWGKNDFCKVSMEH